MACEMFWMVAEEPPPVPGPKRSARKAKGEPGAGFACDAPDESNQKPAKAARPRAAGGKKRTPRVQSERRP